VITDSRGTAHEVKFEKTHHDGMTGAGEMGAVCICGWREYYPFTPLGERFAVLKLQCQAVGHLPTK
jgi:hypothetical protein